MKKIVLLFSVLLLSFGFSTNVNAQEIEEPITYYSNSYMKSYNQFGQYYIMNVKRENVANYRVGGYLLSDTSAMLYSKPNNNIEPFYLKVTFRELVENTGVVGVDKLFLVGSTSNGLDLSYSRPFWGDHGNSNIMKTSTNIPIFKTYEELTKYLITGIPNGQIDTDDSEELDESLVIQHLQYEEVKSVLTSDVTNITWTPLQTDYEVQLLTDIALTHKSSQKVTYLKDVRISSDIYKDTDGMISFKHNKIMSYVLNGANILESPSLFKIEFQRYKLRYKNGNKVGKWQHLKSSMTENTNDYVLDKSLKFTPTNIVRTGTGFWESILGEPRTYDVSWNSKDVSGTDDLRVEVSAIFYAVNKQNGSRIVDDKLYNCVIYQDDIKDISNFYSFEEKIFGEAWFKERFNANGAYGVVLKSLFLRYVYYDDAQKKYVHGDWYRYTITNEPFMDGTNGPMVGEGGSVDIEEDENGNTVIKPNEPPTYTDENGKPAEKPDNGNIDFETGDLADYTKNFFDTLLGMFASFGQFPLLFSTIFSFLPSEIILLIGGGLVVAIICRILGR